VAEYPSALVELLFRLSWARQVESSQAASTCFLLPAGLKG
jgi:hypothetical protein